MGCDIHVFVEYKRQDGDRWSPFGGEVNPGRDYGLFGYLAGVRYTTVTPVAADRGMPADAAYRSQDNDRLYVLDDGAKKTDDREIHRETAETWVRSGLSCWLDDSNRWVSDPDNHSHSWCTAKELVAALDALIADPARKGEPAEPPWHVLVDLLEAFEARGMQSRIVFWFDN